MILLYSPVALRRSKSKKIKIKKKEKKLKLVLKKKRHEKGGLPLSSYIERRGRKNRRERVELREPFEMG